MSFCEHSYDKMLSGVKIPNFYRLRQEYENDALADVYAALRSSCRDRGVLDRIKPGMKVAVAVGSREYANMPEIVKAVVDALLSREARPFIVPSMGSHGGMTAEGQRAVLEHFGITERSMGVPVVSDMSTVCIGLSPSGLGVFMDANAYAADYVVPVNRIKTHTDFKGEYESGLMKMMAIGLGKQQGADICHSRGFSRMSRNVYEFGKVILASGKIAFGIAVVENESHKICRLEAIPSERVEEEEPELLRYSKTRMPEIPFEKVDLILVDRMGKDLSGTGMDTNVIGRSCVLGSFKPFAERVVVFDLTEKSAGNANGMGLADISTKKFFDKIDFDATYQNGITASEPGPGRMSVIMPTDMNAYIYGIRACTGHMPGAIRIVHLKDTLSLKEMYISEGLLKPAASKAHLRLEDEPYEPQFSGNGDFQGYVRRYDGESCK